MNIELKKWHLDNRRDFADICNHTNHAYLTFDFPYPMNEGAARWWLEYAVSNDGITGLYRVILVDGMRVGEIYIRSMEDMSGQLTFLLKQDYESQGIMTIAVRKILQMARQKKLFTKICAKVYACNEKSIHVLLNNAFRLETRNKDVFTLEDGSKCDQCIYVREL